MSIMSQQLRRRELIGGLGVAWLLALVPDADTEGMRVAGEGSIAPPRSPESDD
jgi:hypothetical protein